MFSLCSFYLFFLNSACNLHSKYVCMCVITHYNALRRILILCCSGCLMSCIPTLWGGGHLTGLYWSWSTESLITIQQYLLTKFLSPQRVCWHSFVFNFTFFCIWNQLHWWEAMININNSSSILQHYVQNCKQACLEANDSLSIPIQWNVLSAAVSERGYSVAYFLIMASVL